MADAVSLVSTVVSLPTQAFDMVRKTLDRLEMLEENPRVMDNTVEDLKDISDRLVAVRTSLSSFTCNTQLQLPYKSALSIMGHIDKLIIRAHDNCQRVKFKSNRRRNKIFPSMTKKRLDEIRIDFVDLKTQFHQLESVLFEMDGRSNDITRCPPDGVSIQRNVSDQDVDKFVVVTGMVPRNPQGLYFDFESKDSNGAPLTSAAKFKNAIFNSNLSSIAAVARGDGGEGKTCALHAIGHHQDVLTKFSGGVLYINMGAESGLPQLIDQIAGIVDLSGGKSRASDIREQNDFGKAIQIAGQWFKEEPCLFLIDDVWCVNQITTTAIRSLASISLHDQSRVAYTTRDQKLSGDENVIFGDRQNAEASQILLRSAHMPHLPVTKSAFDAFNSVLKGCAGLPISLDLAGGTVRALSEGRCSRNPDGAWKEYLSWGSDESEDMVRLEDRLKLSLKFVDTTLGDGISLKKFESLCVLRKQQFVPQSIIARLWGEPQSKNLIRNFERFRIIRLDTREDQGESETFVGLHDIILDFARKWAGHDNIMATSSRMLLNTYQVPMETNSGEHPLCETLSNFTDINSYVNPEGIDSGSFRKWWLIDDDGYILQNVFWLLFLAGMAGEATWLILRPDWIIAQWQINGEGQFGNDVDTITNGLSETNISIGERKLFVGFLVVLRKALRLSSKAVHKSSWEGIRWFQLYGRLMYISKESQIMSNFLQQIENESPKPWLKPSFGCLESAGGALEEKIDVEGSVFCQRRVGSTILICYMSCDWWHVKQYETLDGSETVEELEYDSDMLLDHLDRIAVFSKNGKLLAIPGVDGIVFLFERDGQSAHFSKIAVLSLKSTSQMEDIKDNSEKPGIFEEEANPFVDTFGLIVSCLVIHDESKVICGYSDMKIRVWDLKDGLWCPKVLLEQYGEAQDIAICADGSRVVSTLNDKNMFISDLIDGSWNSTMLSDQENRCCVAICDDGSRIVSVSMPCCSVHVWDFKNGWWESTVIEKHQRGLMVRCVSICGDGSRFVSGSIDKCMHVYDLKGELWHSTASYQRDDQVSTVSICNDGSWVVSGSLDGVVRVWDAQSTFGNSTVPQEHGEVVRGVAICGNGSVVVSRSEDGDVRVWDWRDGSWTSNLLHGYGEYVDSVAICGDGYRIVSAVDGSTVDTRTVRVWDFRDGSWVPTVQLGHNHGDVSLTICPGEPKVVPELNEANARSSDSDIDETTIYELAEREAIVAMCTDGSRVVSGTKDGIVVVWDLIDGSWSSNSLKGHTDWLTSFAISNDGNRLVSASRDHVRVWDLNDGLWNSTVLREYDGFVMDVRLCQGGQCIKCKYDDGRNRIYNSKDRTWSSVGWDGCGSSGKLDMYCSNGYIIGEKMIGPAVIADVMSAIGCVEEPMVAKSSFFFKVGPVDPTLAFVVVMP